MPPATVRRDREWLRQVFLIYLLPSALINIGNLSAYVFQIVVGQSLGVEAFGAFNALFSTILIITAPSNFVPLIVSQVAMDGAGDQSFERSVLSTFMLYSAAGGVILVAGSLVAAYLMRDRFEVDLSTGLAAMVTIFMVCLHPVAIGLVQARRRYIHAAILIGGNPVLRVLFGIVLVALLGFGAAGAMWSVAAPFIVTNALGILILHDLLRAPGGRLPEQVRKSLWQSSWRQAALVTLIITLSNLDIVIVQIILSDVGAGHYSAAAVVSRIALLLPSALATIIFTESARSHGPGYGAAFPWGGIALTAALAGSIALAFVMLADPIIAVMFGADYAPAAPLLRITGCAMAALSVSQAVMMTLAGRRDFASLRLMLVAVLLIAVVPATAGLGATGLALLMLAANLGLLAACLGIAVRRSRTLVPR